MLPAATHETAGTVQDPAGLPARRPGGAVGRVLNATYAGVPESAGEARHRLARVLAGVPVVEDAVFCLGEVATNAVVHSRSGRPGGRFTVTADVLPGVLVVLAVADEGGTWTGREADTYPHGLEIARELALFVGIDGDELGRTVWVVLAWERPDDGPVGV
jgi:serine/threonine-protein kinase RsbW